MKKRKKKGFQEASDWREAKIIFVLFSPRLIKIAPRRNYIRKISQFRFTAFEQSCKRK
jgi:hypothetical protein